MKLRVYWIRDGKSTYFNVKDVEEAKKVIERETQKDLRDPHVTWNASGLEVFEDGEWSEYYNDEGLDIKEVMEEDEEKQI